MPLCSNTPESEVVVEKRFSRMSLGDSSNRSINMKRTGVLWKRNVGEKELTLVDERGAKTYSTNASVLVKLKSDKICCGTFVEVKVRENVIETLKPVEFEGKVKKFAKNYAFLMTPILPQIKLKGDCKRTVDECRIVKNPPHELASIWFNPTSLPFPVTNDQPVFFCVCLTLRKIKRTRNPPYLDVHAIKLRLHEENGGGVVQSPVAWQEQTGAQQTQKDESTGSQVPTSPEASLRDWMDVRMGKKHTSKLGKPLYESKPAPRVPKGIRRSQSEADIPKSSKPRRLWNTRPLRVTPALQKHLKEKQALLEEKFNQNARMWPSTQANHFQTPSVKPDRFTTLKSRSKQIPTSKYYHQTNQNILPSLPPSKASATSTIWTHPAEQMSGLQIEPFGYEKRQRTQVEFDVPFVTRGLKSSRSTNDLPSRLDNPIYHSTPEIWDTRSGTSQVSTEAAMTSLAGRTSPSLSWLDAGAAHYGTETVDPMKTRNVISNWSSMPDLTRTPEDQRFNNSLHNHEGICRTSSLPRINMLKENYRANFQEQDLESKNFLYEANVVDGPETLSPLKSRSLISNWSSMPDLTRTLEEQRLPESRYSHEKRLGMYRANSTPRFCKLQENYRSKFQDLGSISPMR